MKPYRYFVAILFNKYEVLLLTFILDKSKRLSQESLKWFLILTKLVEDNIEVNLTHVLSGRNMDLHSEIKKMI